MNLNVDGCAWIAQDKSSILKSCLRRIWRERNRVSSNLQKRIITALWQSEAEDAHAQPEPSHSGCILDTFNILFEYFALAWPPCTFR